MPHTTEEVKGIGRQVRSWIDCHPLTGWWLAAIGVTNIFLNLLELVGK